MRLIGLLAAAILPVDGCTSSPSTTSIDPFDQAGTTPIIFGSSYR
jgi:hypothetical protein